MLEEDDKTIELCLGVWKGEIKSFVTRPRVVHSGAG
jgi:hypothetical protein